MLADYHQNVIVITNQMVYNHCIGLSVVIALLLLLCGFNGEGFISCISFAQLLQQLDGGSPVDNRHCTD